MNDKNGQLIQIGDTVESVQPSGGVLAPAPAQRGKVEYTKNLFDEQVNIFCIVFKKDGQNFNSRILLLGKINTIIKKGK